MLIVLHCNRESPGLLEPQSLPSGWSIFVCYRGPYQLGMSQPLHHVITSGSVACNSIINAYAFLQILIMTSDLVRHTHPCLNSKWFYQLRRDKGKMGKYYLPVTRVFGVATFTFRLISSLSTPLLSICPTLAF